MSGINASSNGYAKGAPFVLGVQLSELIVTILHLHSDY